MASNNQVRMQVRSGFTLLEILVASLLLGMLVTILTMVFNSSSIAWRTGKAGISQLSQIRRTISLAEYRADNLLPCVDEKDDSAMGLIGTAWKPDGTLRTRAVSKLPSDNGFSQPSYRKDFNSARASNPGGPAVVEVQNGESIKMGSSTAYTVGVLSYGPDGIRDTDDDITTWPLEIK